VRVCVCAVIPDEAHFGGTIRATSDEHVQTLRQRLQQVVTSQAASFGCTAEVDWMLDRHPYYPPVVNHPDAAAFLSDVAGQLLGTDAVVRDVEATMAGEDFAFFTRKVPSAFAFLGIRNETLGSVHGLHTARFTLDESALKIGAALHAALATQYLEDSRRGSGTGTWSEYGASSGWEAVAAKDEL
jgi:metal-dependent amidase/aminoacylase/carboxypeptidase family protein